MSRLLLFAGSGSDTRAFALAPARNAYVDMAGVLVADGLIRQFVNSGGSFVSTGATYSQRIANYLGISAPSYGRRSWVAPNGVLICEDGA